jgi:hypothetical protein
LSICVQTTQIWKRKQTKSVVVKAAIGIPTKYSNSQFYVLLVQVGTCALSYYRNECEVLTAAIRVHEQEFSLLQKREDAIREINCLLSQQEAQLHLEYRTLEFTYAHQMTSAQLPKVTNYLQRAQEEHDTISSTKVPWLIFDIQPQYSMMNYLRLSHKK